MRISNDMRVVSTLGVVTKDLRYYSVDYVSADGFTVRPYNHKNFRYRVSNTDKDDLLVSYWFWFAKNEF
jgi:hypothetical protein